MRFGYRERCLDHDTGSRHPETADRLRAIRRGLARLHGVEYVDAPAADRETLTAVHDAQYVADVESFCADGGGNWDADTVAVEATFDAAAVSAGLAVWAAEAALDGADGRQTPFSLGRPPGHHAETDEAMGFCFFNNAAVAAGAAREQIDRVAILDWDVHHGNGTQEIFESDPDVFYASIHEQGLFPGTGAIDETGLGEGDGTTLNVPLSGGCDDADYAAILSDVIGPAIERFDPGLFIISAGFDAHEHDPISRMRVSTEGFGVLTDRVRTIANETDAALAFVLEGGYGLEALSESVAMVHETFDGREPIEPDGDPSTTVEERITEARSIHGLE